MNILMLLRFGKEMAPFKKFALETVKARIAKGGKYKDLFYYLVRSLLHIRSVFLICLCCSLMKVDRELRC